MLAYRLISSKLLSTCATQTTCENCSLTSSFSGVLNRPTPENKILKAWLKLPVSTLQS